MRYEIRNADDEVVNFSATIVGASVWLVHNRFPGDTVWDTETGYEVKM